MMYPKSQCACSPPPIPPSTHKPNFNNFSFRACRSRRTDLSIQGADIADDLKPKWCLKEDMHVLFLYDMAIKTADDHVRQRFRDLPGFPAERCGLMARWII
jgi:hypothetical protein